MNESTAESGTDASIYLDNAATSFPKPEAVYAAADTWLRTSGAAIGRGSHAATAAASRMVEQCRQRVADLIGAESADRIAFTFNCTDSLNLLLRGFLNHGDSVLTTELEHNSVLRPLNQLQQERQLDVVYVPFDARSGEVDPTDLVAQLRKTKPRLLVLNHASNVTGVIQPVAEIIREARKLGCFVLLDAAQTVGHFPFRVTDLGADFLAAAGHKGMLGPLGTGVIYIRQDCERLIRPVRSGGTGTASESIEQPSVMPTMLESGNMNGPGLAGLNAAVDWLNRTGVSGLHEQAVRHINSLAAGLRELPGVRICCDSGGDANLSKRTGILSLTIQDQDSRDVAGILESSFNISCRAGMQCAPIVHRRLETMRNGGTIRLSVGPFTTDRDVEAAATAVGEIARML